MLTLLLSVTIYLIGIILIAVVIMQRKEAPATVAWLLLITTLPLIGVLFFLWFGVARVERRVRMRQRSISALQPKLSEMDKTLSDFEIRQEESFDAPVQRQLISMSREMKTFNVRHGNSITFMEDAQIAMKMLSSAIRDAQDTIHMEFYIFQNDKTGRMIRDLLIEAAERGVEVRLLIDGIGSWSIRRSFTRPLIQAGVKFSKYLPVTFLGRPWHVNLRNHRKIAVIDGVIGFCGSMNIEDELRRKLRFCEYMISCKGPLVQELQETFATDWFFATRENLIAERYFPIPLRSGHGVGQVVTSGPDEREQTLFEIVCSAIHAAQDHVLITTPYIVPDQALIVALRSVALRGVNVRIITSRFSPNIQERLARIAGNSYYEDLLSAGVEIWEYTSGFMHAKSVCVDGCFASVGTANLDIRSFRLNFEVNINLYSRDSVMEIEQAFEENLRRSERIDEVVFRKRPTLRKLTENSLRVLSPIL